MKVLSKMYAGAQDPFMGKLPSVWCGDTLPDGTVWPWKDAGIGSRYHYVAKNAAATASIVVVYTKMTNVQAGADWIGRGSISQTGVSYDDFTDQGAAYGDLVLDYQLPVGARVDEYYVANVTGFGGNTSAALEVGKSDDKDSFGAAVDLDVFSDVDYASGGPAQKWARSSSAEDIYLTVTSATDYSSVDSGELDISVIFGHQV